MCIAVASLAQPGWQQTRVNGLTWQATLDVISDRLTE
jgi:hypothetical protein